MQDSFLSDFELFNRISYRINLRRERAKLNPCFAVRNKGVHHNVLKERHIRHEMANNVPAQPADDVIAFKCWRRVRYRVHESKLTQIVENLGSRSIAEADLSDRSLDFRTFYVSEG